MLDTDSYGTNSFDLLVGSSSYSIESCTQRVRVSSDANIFIPMVLHLSLDENFLYFQHIWALFVHIWMLTVSATATHLSAGRIWRHNTNIKSNTQIFWKSRKMLSNDKSKTIGMNSFASLKTRISCVWFSLVYTNSLAGLAQQQTPALCYGWMSTDSSFIQTHHNFCMASWAHLHSEPNTNYSDWSGYERRGNKRNICIQCYFGRVFWDSFRRAHFFFICHRYRQI